MAHSLHRFELISWSTFVKKNGNIYSSFLCKRHACGHFSANCAILWTVQVQGLVICFEKEDISAFMGIQDQDSWI